VRRGCYKQSDCWIVIKGKVYDVTSYVEEHPGGESILKNAGCAPAALGNARTRRDARLPARARAWAVAWRRV
jgi:hypothetical protein